MTGAYTEPHVVHRKAGFGTVLPPDSDRLPEALRLAASRVLCLFSSVLSYRYFLLPIYVGPLRRPEGRPHVIVVRDGHPHLTSPAYECSYKPQGNPSI